MPSPPIKPAAYDFGDLLSIGSFRVPRYQRAYDWDGEQVSDFARDILTVVEARLDGEPARHFFGAIISIYEPQQRFEVVDGQQRLTTHMLCLKELRYQWLLLAEQATQAKKVSIRRSAVKRADGLQERIFSNGVPRLSLSKRDKDYFSDLLMDVAREPRRGDDQSHRRLWAARETLRADLFDPLLAMSPQYAVRVKRLEAVEDALLSDGYVVHLNTNDGSNAYRLFSVLNDRGRPLSVGELLRTHTLAALETYTPQQDAAEVDWDVILRRGDAFVKRFLAAYYVSHVGTRAPTGEMFDRFWNRFLGDEVASPSGATRLREKIATLRSEADTFSRLYDGEWPYDDSSKPQWDQDRLRRLVKALRHHLADPLLLATARESNEGDFRDLVLRLELFAFRYINIVNANAARLGDVYYRHAQIVRATGRLDKNKLRKELAGLLAVYAPDSVFETLLGEQLRYANKKARIQLIRHFLTTVEDYEQWFRDGATGKPKPRDKTSLFVLDNVNIEHVYPQNPVTGNRLLDNLKHSLGNLTALDEQEGVRAGNKDFADKKAVYARSRFQITKPLGRLTKWDQTSISKRADFYAERAKRIFVVK